MSIQTTTDTSNFNIIEASIDDHRRVLDSGRISSVDLIIAYLNRIAACDIAGGLNAFTLINPKVLEEAVASDARRATGQSPRPLEGIPYTLKDSYKYLGLTVTNGSPALEGLMSNEDSAMAARLREAGAILLGKTNMPPMAAGGMQRGLYGRAESPYNPKYLTAAFSSGSSNGVATSTASSMAVFGMGSETVSSGRSPASNNALVCYTPSRGVLSCRGLWPLYVTCDVPVPYARSVDDLFIMLDVISEPDPEIKGDFWREQTHVDIPKLKKVDYSTLRNRDALKGKRIGVPKMYVGQKDSNPHAKHPYVNEEVVQLWDRAAKDIEGLGAEILYTDFPLITNYEDDSISGEANNVRDAPGDWNQVERTTLIARAWDDFLNQNADPKLKSFADLDPDLLFPKPEAYLPDTLLEVRNWIDYAGLPALAETLKDVPIFGLPGLAQALKALEAQRKRDLEDWMDSLGLDAVAFPAQGDVGLADLEFNLESTKHSLRNGVKYSHGNRAIRHLGVPTVSVPMGVIEVKGMPVNLTFAGRAYEDQKLLQYAYAYEQSTKRRVVPRAITNYVGDVIPRNASTPPTNREVELTISLETTKTDDGMFKVRLLGSLSAVDSSDSKVEIYLDGKKAWEGSVEKETWEVSLEHKTHRPERLGWNLKPLKQWPVMVLVVVKAKGSHPVARLSWVKSV